MTRIFTRTITLPIEGHSITINIPAHPDQILEQAVQGEANGDHQTDPYWGLLWDAAPRTARCILRHAQANGFARGLKTVELGCGVGLAGIAGLLAGLDVTLTDLVPSAVEMACGNAVLNGFSDARGQAVDWRNPPDETYDFIVASDVLYDSANHRPLLNTITRMLAENGVVWIGDAGRANSPLFIHLAEDEGWKVSILDEDQNELLAPTHVRFQLIVLRR
ncbi:MAG: methyltransferase domain-containing protein [Planctomycetaceae bacterium]